MGLSLLEMLSASAIGYVLGSIPFGLVFCFIAGYGDIRKIGSGNIGATNVLRTGNKILAFLTLFFDISKGAIAVLITKYMFGVEAALIAGAASILGHCFPVWLKFQGGKGVATTLGTIAALNLYIGLATAGLWLLSALLFRISSLSALIALALAPILSAVWVNINLALTLFFIAILVFIRHKENIQRLLKGEEPKIGKKKKEAKTTSSDTPN